MRVATLRRAATLLLPGALLATAVTALPADAQAMDWSYYALRSPAGSAATWSIGRLTDGTHANGDHDLTADVVLGLAATGTGGEAADRATDWLEDRADDYLSPHGHGTSRVLRTAKLALVADVQGRDAADFGGHDLTSMLRGRLRPDGRFTEPGGRHGRPTTADRISHSMAVLALARTGEVPEQAADFLAARPCPGNGYPLAFTRRPGTACVPDTDATAMTVQALIAAGRTTEAHLALDWLLAQGTYAYGQYGQLVQWSRTGGIGPDPVTTSRVAQALAAIGASGQQRYEVSLGLQFLQYRCSGQDKTLRGAVWYGSPATPSLYATAQAMPGLAGTWLYGIDGTAADPEPHEIYCYSDWATTGTPSVGGDGGGDIGGAADGIPGSAVSGSGSSSSSGSSGGSSGGYAVGGTSEGGYSVSTSTTTEGTTSEGGYSVTTSTTSEGGYSVTTSTTSEGGYSVSTSTTTEGTTSEDGYSVTTSTTSEGTTSEGTTAGTSAGGDAAVGGNSGG
ncbi:hypothetical protein [Streptomyces sp. YIM 98790]|uniref:hypothetical protein n=1 Tax=Streptomyces sp. YIM 98790 TaxID=2689077 RepID=UPI00140C5020|nr:hypothetical protein [Streptomyces sp. YIM 98790]